MEIINNFAQLFKMFHFKENCTIQQARYFISLGSALIKSTVEHDRLKQI